ncbi:Porin P precursor [Rubripirellula lacrimiformis]|uniref:Porin P n=1 Tax=Rubripirellula lacrimiformis TaxID=1930273 RepID=A0A517NBP2_9BACT|nr:porin [Rubripirellula lacrimiformis]QDT04557.1 Porin P precursor [Rubripirellula lacrimiformis]
MNRMFRYGWILGMAASLVTASAWAATLADEIQAVSTSDPVAERPASPMATPGQGLDVAEEFAKMQAQIDELKVSTATPVGFPAAACSPAAPAAKYPSVRLTGFFQADSGWFSQSDANRLAVGIGVIEDGDVQDGSDFRRARLAAVGDVWDNVSYMLEMDFAFPGRPSFMDVWLDIDVLDGDSHLRIGQYRQPVGMDGLTSVKDMTFLERGLPFAFLPFRQIGAMWYGVNRTQDITWAISGFRFPTDVYANNVGDNGGYAMAARLTGLMVDAKDGGAILHVGASYSYLDPANDQIQIRNQPEVFVGENGLASLGPAGVPSFVPPFVDTGQVATEHVNLLGAELAGVLGAFHWQTEALFANVDQKGGPSLVFPGAYVQAGYFLTGETRPYNRSAGVLGRIKPNCSVGKEGGIGAWELAVRYSTIDLNDKNIQGNRLNNVTGGVNWYMNPFTKFQFNYIHAMLDSPAYGSSNADIVAMRAQLDF